MCSDLVGMAGFEPAASCSQSRRANQAAPHPADRSVAYRPACYCPGRSLWPWSARRPRASSPVAGRAVSALGNSCGYAIGAHLAGTLSPRQTRGRSSMAEPQPSKLVMRVRFPSPAPTDSPGHSASSGCAARGESAHGPSSCHTRATRPPDQAFSRGSSAPSEVGKRTCRARSPSASAMARSRSRVACW